MNRTKSYICIALALLFIISGVMYFFPYVRIIEVLKRWTFVAISVVASACIVWSFAGVFVSKVSHKMVILLLAIVFAITVYTLTHQRPSVVHMKEDVLYIKPYKK